MFCTVRFSILKINTANSNLLYSFFYMNVIGWMLCTVDLNLLFFLTVTTGTFRLSSQHCACDLRDLLVQTIHTISTIQKKSLFAPYLRGITFHLHHHHGLIVLVLQLHRTHNRAHCATPLCICTWSSSWLLIVSSIGVSSVLLSKHIPKCVVTLSLS